MPTSRKRRPRRPSTTPRPPSRRHAAFPDELRPYLEVALRADAAEALGDADAALEALSTMPVGPDGRPYWRPWRLRRLAQLVAYDGYLPRWATSRWVLDQALQQMDHDSNDRVTRAMLVAKSAGAADLMPPGLVDTETRCRIMDRDWVFRQVFLYELDGLVAFVQGVAAPDLLVAADDLQAWMQAPVDAYRFVSSTSLTITWEHVGSRRMVETANLGTAVMLVPGEHVLGRLVPVEGGEMFESVPLLVTEPLAQQIAHEPSRWIEALRAARGTGDQPIRTGGFAFGLLHDVPPFVWEHVLGSDTGPDGRLGIGFDAQARVTEVARTVLELVRTAHGPVVPEGLRVDRHPERIDEWPVLAAALLEPIVLCELTLLVRPDDAAAFEALATVLPEPAAAACRAVISSCRSVA